MKIRTDLALEANELNTQQTEGIKLQSKNVSGIKISRLKITSKSASLRLDKPAGTYITIEMPDLSQDFTQTDERLQLISKEIESLVPKEGCILVAGIGNVNITADALGPNSADMVLATRHISKELAKEIGLEKLRSVAVISPGVLGQTGIETGEILLSLIKKIKPSAVIAIDALASRRLERLGHTLQISDTGISPGAGVGNNRFVLNKESIGVPVIGIGMPTVVDAITLVADTLLPNDEEAADEMVRKLSLNCKNMVVTPKDIDLLIERSSKLTAMAINCALHTEMTQEDLLSLTNYM